VYYNFIERSLSLSINELLLYVLKLLLFSCPYFVGGPSGSGKTSLAQKMANIIGCEVTSLESYYKPEQVRDYKYDEYSSLDIALLTKVMPFSLTKSTDQFCVL
jgi:energy-coupling factor transporter ATP-binding protein EcfA2